MESDHNVNFIKYYIYGNKSYLHYTLKAFSIKLRILNKFVYQKEFVLEGLAFTFEVDAIKIMSFKRIYTK